MAGAPAAGPVPGPLSGIRAISFGTAIAGALSGTALAELGADVVKIESPTRADNLRRLWAPEDPVVHEPSGADTSPMFANFNRTTRSVALDMKDAESVALFLRLAAAADVIVENYAPGVMQRWGLGYEQIAAVNPRIVMLSLTGFGHSGPRSHYLAYGATVCTFVGLTDAWRYPSGVHFDYLSEAHGVFGVLAALAARDRTGRGTHVDLAEVETAAAVMGPMMLDYVVNGRASVVPGNQVPGALLSEVVRCHGDDSWLAVEIEDAADWATLAEFLGRADRAEAVQAPDDQPPDEQARAALGAALAAWAASGPPSRPCGCCRRPAWPPGRCRTPRTWCATRSTGSGTTCSRWITRTWAWPSTRRPRTGWPRRRPWSGGRPRAWATTRWRYSASGWACPPPRPHPTSGRSHDPGAEPEHARLPGQCP